MKLKLSLCTTATTTNDSPTTTSTTTSPSSSSTLTSCDSLQSHRSLQTLPSVPSLQLSLTPLTLTLTHSLSSSHSLSSPISSLSLSSSNNHLYVCYSHKINVYHLPSFSLLETFNSNGASHGAVKSIAFYNSKILTAHQDGKIRVWKLNAESPYAAGSTHLTSQTIMKKGKYSDCSNRVHHTHWKISWLYPKSSSCDNNCSDRVQQTTMQTSWVDEKLNRGHYYNHIDCGLCKEPNIGHYNCNSNVVSLMLTRHKLVSTLPTLTEKLTRFPLRKNHVKVTRHKTRLWIEHNDAVSSLAISNGRFIYSVSWDKTLKVWDPKSLRCKESVTVHEDAVNAVIVSCDGVIYTGSADGLIRVWARAGTVSGHARVATLEKHKSSVNALALNIDGTILYSGSCDRSILVWEKREKNGNNKYEMGVSGALRGHGGAILCLINVCDFLISGSSDRTVRIWRRGFDGKFSCLSVLSGHMKAVKCLVGEIMEGEDGIIRVISGGLDGVVKVWSVKFNFSSSINDL